MSDIVSINIERKERRFRHNYCPEQVVTKFGQICPSAHLM